MRFGNLPSPLVIYHANCTDGFGAAYAAWCDFGNKADYVPANYGDCVISGDSIQIRDVTYSLPGRTVVIVDFSLPVSEFALLRQQAEYVIWLDHHKGAIDDWLGPQWLAEGNTRYEHLDGSTKIVLDNQHSGAYLAWENFMPEHRVPALIRHIEDRDLWLWNLSQTKAIMTAIRLEPQKFEVWDHYFQSDDHLTPLEEDGNVLVRALEARMEEFAHSSHTIINLNDKTGKRYAFVSANVTNDISETGQALNRRYALPSCTFFVKDSKVICSLRSQGGVDVNAIAKHYGGGGHKNAAGFKMSIHRFFSEIWIS